MIVRNSIECPYCGKVLESTHRHDYRTHSCKRPDGTDSHMMVDGGKEYLRRGWGRQGDYIETSICTPDEPMYDPKEPR